MLGLGLLAGGVYVIVAWGESPFHRFGRLFTCAGPHCMVCNRTAAHEKKYYGSPTLWNKRGDENVRHFCDRHWPPPGAVGRTTSTALFRNFIRLVFCVAILVGFAGACCILRHGAVSGSWLWLGLCAIAATLVLGAVLGATYLLDSGADRPDRTREHPPVRKISPSQRALPAPGPLPAPGDSRSVRPPNAG